MKRLAMCLAAVLLATFWAAVASAQVKGEVTEDASTKQQVDRLISQGGNYYSRGDFEKAIKIAEAALVLDPENASAKELKSISEEGIRDRDRRNFVVDQRRQFQRDLRQIDRQMVGQSETLKEGPNWDLVRQRTGGVYGEAARVMTANEPIERRLDELTINVDFKGASLAEVANFLSTISKLNVQVDPRVTVKEKPAAELPVTFQGKDMKLRSVLQWVTRFTGLTYTIRDEIVLITDREHLEEFKVTAVYDITDLVAEIPDYPSVPWFDTTLPGILSRRIGDGFRRVPDLWHREGIMPFTGAYFADYEGIPRYFMTEPEVRALVEALIEAEENKGP